jgi:hypothetical protein
MVYAWVDGDDRALQQQVLSYESSPTGYGLARYCSAECVGAHVHSHQYWCKPGQLHTDATEAGCVVSMGNEDYN